MMRRLLLLVFLCVVVGSQIMADDMSYDDKQKIHQIERDIERLSGSSIGDAKDRQMQIEALMRQQELIYSKYGAQASPRIVIQDQRDGRRK